MRSKKSTEKRMRTKSKLSEIDDIKIPLFFKIKFIVLNNFEDFSTFLDDVIFYVNSS